jgi:ketosteroid isomerase-like protein
MDAIGFSQAWAAAWNNRDLEAVLQHFAEDAVFTSPVVQRIGFASDGVVRGKAELRRYWTAALAHNLDLQFQVTGLYEGVDMFVIGYQDQQGADRMEVLVFRDGLVVEGYGTFAAGHVD